MEIKLHAQDDDLFDREGGHGNGHGYGWGSGSGRVWMDDQNGHGWGSGYGSGYGDGSGDGWGDGNADPKGWWSWR